MLVIRCILLFLRHNGPALPFLSLVLGAGPPVAARAAHDFLTSAASRALLGGAIRTAIAALLLLCVRDCFAADNQIPDSASTISRGYQRYQGVCGHCHGPDGLGSAFAPSLIDRPIAYKEFRDIALNGRARGTSAMPGYATDPNVAPYLDAIFSYLKARHEGLGRGRPPAP
ncbi:cytochrome c [Rhodoblastus acidophilus]|uniref:Cytochrome c n=1 Tax=Candidatus Rhodoblastus alkanivorans TaxID=2954117 RepID=A0ABS9Z0Y4_9HYPH|nr:cytochrome c [Candidatus Rhodoblastus alkanivorans]MCI4680782.1 cytochrome c [Candidatus Rhodoblastus alkanivorans]MCI4681319.1 cytochrome c [Candidatus Rhodoblastus alkanivorans]MDI4642366.1 cytochrome c [Rhodoblastus acidophilus]